MHPRQRNPRLPPAPRCSTGSLAISDIVRDILIPDNLFAARFRLSDSSSLPRQLERKRERERERRVSISRGLSYSSRQIPQCSRARSRSRSARRWGFARPTSSASSGRTSLYSILTCSWTSTRITWIARPRNRRRSIRCGTSASPTRCRTRSCWASPSSTTRHCRRITSSPIAASRSRSSSTVTAKPPTSGLVCESGSFDLSLNLNQVGMYKYTLALRCKFISSFLLIPSSLLM